jgi:hypothetical protein
MQTAIRGHWRIESGLHWILDVAFREDDNRVREDHATENLAVLRNIAVNLLNRARNGKASIKTMRSRAGWDEIFLAQLVSQKDAIAVGLYLTCKVNQPIIDIIGI